MLNKQFKETGIAFLEVSFPKKVADRLSAACGSLHGKYETHPKQIAEILNYCKSEIQEKVGPDIYYSGNYEFRREDDFYAYNLHHDCKGSIPFTNTVDELYNSFKTNSRAPTEIEDNDYPIFRLAIYLTDLRALSGGTKLLPGTHKKYPFFRKQGFIKMLGGKFGENFGFFAKSINPTCWDRPITVVVFNARVYHSGHFLRYRFDKNFVMPWWFDNHLKRLMKFKWTRRLVRFLVYPFPEKRDLTFIDLVAKSPFALAYQADRYMCGNPSLGEFLIEEKRDEFFSASGFPVLEPFFLKMYAPEFDEINLTNENKKGK